MNNTKIISIVIFLVLVGSGLYVLTQWRRPLDKVIMIEQNADKPQTKIFYWDTPPASAKVGQTFSVFLKANAGMADVTGYDVVVQYDPQFGNLQKHTVLSPNFDTYVREERGLVSLTGIKKISVQTAITLNNERMIELSFMPVKAGLYVFKVVPQHNKAKTKIVDSKSDIISQDVADEFTVNVQ